MNTLPKENTNVLDDNWILTGNDIDEFNREITKFDKMTFSKKCYMKSIDFGDIVDGDVLSLLKPSANYEDAYNKFSDVHSKLNLNKILDVYDKEVVKEMCENTFVLSEAKDDDDFIENQYDGKTLTIEVDNIDFLHKREDFASVIKQIDKSLIEIEHKNDNKLCI